MWSNFEIADANFFRSPAYQAFFEFLDKKGGFFLERWGDAPVHSIAVALFLPRSAVHNFDDIAYYHGPFTHCPKNKDLFQRNNCYCKPEESFDDEVYSCAEQFWRVSNTKPSY